MNLYDKLYNMDNIYGIWHYTQYIRVTYVSQGWLVIWDHRQTPPTRYDYHMDDHHQSCLAAINALQDLTTS